MSDNMLIYKLKKNVTLKKLGVLFLGLLFMVTFLFVGGSLNPIVQFEDKNLEKVILENLNRTSGPIYRSELQKITHLDASNRSIESLEGIQYLIRLNELDLSLNSIKDYDNLRYLKRLSVLKARDNSIEDLKFLKPLKNIIKLDLRNNNIEEISDLKHLSRLAYLNLRDNNIKKISVISELERLVYLNLHSNHQIETIEPIKHLIHLEELILENISVGEEVTHLTYLVKLHRLNLENTDISCIEALRGLTYLRVLDLSYNRITSIDAIKEFTLLKKLNLRNNEVANIESLAFLVQLRYLNLHSNSEIESVESLRYLTNLETLIIRNISLTNQEHVFENLVNLNDLNVSDTNIQDTSVFNRLYQQGALQGEIRGIFLENSLKSPKFSIDAGFYSKKISIDLVNLNRSGTIYYTLDGSEPTTNSQMFENPIIITEKENQAKVVRAIVIDEKNKSDIATNTYFISETIDSRFTLPVISLSTNNDYLFSSSEGIYHNNNFNSRGRDWEKVISFEFFSSDGQREFVQDAGIRIHGGATRRYTQKSLRLYAREEYGGNQYFEYDFFENSPSKTSFQHFRFDELILRNAGNDWSTAMLRDPFTHILAESFSDLSTSAYLPTAVFINGRYWGLYNLREKYNANYLSRNYGIETSNYTILSNNAIFEDGDYNGRREYLSLRDSVADGNLSKDDDYNKIIQEMDISDYIDYLIIQTFIGNVDWPQNNILYWKSNSDTDESIHHDNKWRWMVWDTDFGFSRYTNWNGMENTGLPHHDMITWIFSEYNQRRNEAWPNVLTYHLQQNESFVNQFVTRYMYVLENHLQHDKTSRILEDLASKIENEMYFHIKRFPRNLVGIDSWINHIQKIENYLVLRPDYVRQHLKEYFEIE